MGEKDTYRFEYFPKYDVQPCTTGVEAYSIQTDKCAEVISYFVKSNPYMFTRKDPTPAAYMYENGEGERFLVFSFNGYYNGEAMDRSYARARQISDAVQWLTGKKLPAFVYGNPDLYIMTKVSDGEMAVGLWNCSADYAMEPTVELDGEYRDVEFINCTGELQGDKVLLCDIPAFTFAAVVVKK